MANLQERRDKTTGKLLSYSIRVYRGRDNEGKQLKPYTATFDISPSWSEKTAKKKAEAFAATFEKECKDGITSDSRQTFAQYADYVLSLKERRGDKHTTITDYRNMTMRIYPVIGHIKLRSLRPEHLNNLYALLAEDGANLRTGGKLSNNTIHRYHRFISIVLSQAVKEGLISINVASRAEPPKLVKHEANYLQPSEVSQLLTALEKEPLKWQALILLMLVSGCRRGEVLGLKWHDVDMTNSRIYICRSISYTPDKGVYESTPKTASSKRYISLPVEATSLLRKYKAWQSSEIIRLGEYYQRNDYVFSQDNGSPLHPDSVTTWLYRFSKRNGLPHISPHALRHTMTSMLIFNGIDIVSTSKRLGHSQVSTTSDIYAHIVEAADKKNADLLGEILLKKA